MRSDVAAVLMEEAAPVAVSAASMRMPGEVFRAEQDGAPTAEGEMSRCVSDSWLIGEGEGQTRTGRRRPRGGCPGVWWVGVGVESGGDTGRWVEGTVKYLIAHLTTM